MKLIDFPILHVFLVTMFTNRSIIPELYVIIILNLPTRRTSESAHCGGAYSLPNNWYNDMPTDTTSKTTPTNLAVSNSGDCNVGSTAYEYEDTMTTPIKPTSIGFYVRNHKIPTSKPQNTTIDIPWNIWSNGCNIVPNGLEVNAVSPSSQSAHVRPNSM